MKEYRIFAVIAIVLYGIMYFILSFSSRDTYVAMLQGDYEAKYVVTDPNWKYDKPTYHLNDSFIHLDYKPIELPIVWKTSVADITVDKDAKMKFLSGDSLQAFLNEYYEPNSINAYAKGFIKNHFKPRIFQTGSWKAGELGVWMLIVPFLFLVMTIIFWFNTDSNAKEEEAHDDGRGILSLCTFSCIITLLTAAWVYTGYDVYCAYNSYWGMLAVFLLFVVAAVIAFAMVLACIGALSGVFVIKGASMGVKELMKGLGCGVVLGIVGWILVAKPLGIESKSLEGYIIELALLGLGTGVWLVRAYMKNRTAGLKYLPEIILCLMFFFLAGGIVAVAILFLYFMKSQGTTFFRDSRGRDRINPNQDICSQCRRNLEGCDKTCLYPGNHCERFVHKDGGV